MLIQVPLRSGQGPWISVGLRFWESFSLGSLPGFRPSRPYFRVCVLVAAFWSTETSLYTLHTAERKER